GNSSTMSLELHCAKKCKVAKKIVHTHNVRTSHQVINKLFKHYVNKNANLKFACSKEAGEFLFQKDFHIIQNCIDTNKFKFSMEKRQELRKQYKIEDEVFLFGNVGRLNEQKNQRFLIENFPEILKIIPNSKLMIVGMGPKKEELTALVQQLNLKDKIIFAGFQTDISSYMSCFDLFLFPSSFEGYGMVAVEAQSTGLMCLVSNKVPSTVNVGGNCVFYEYDNQEDFLDQLEKTYTKDLNREENRLKCLESFEKNDFALEKNVLNLENLYLS
ncbi:MAG: glycosyltransferase, partial [Anaeroplasmataceae bacterium]|nr:glycosyltransferase [Anaeroplasmataceae bacterium]